ncbi:L,D-transpeptidase family protein [Nitratifractor sp.]|uniref:L,D-transpeptidase family protein n=1 Tax=Nitratifractor sp. TaxID=2268144 RepID=UPI0025FFD58D|nr:L,D-transpeptidase family protein [Nitratifractor sp.]
MKRSIFLFILTSFFLLAAPPSIGKTSGNIDVQIAETLASKVSSPYRETLTQLYALTKDRPLWVGPENGARFSALMRLLDNPLYNYQNRNFNRNEIKYLSFSLDNGGVSEAQRPKVLARLDVLMSDALLHLLHFVRVGDVDWALVRQKLARLKETQDVQAVWEIHPRKMPDAKALLKIIQSGGLRSYLRQSLPLERRYRDLIAILHKYRRMPDFPRLHEGRRLEIGDSDDRIAQIKRMLMFFGDYPARGSVDSMFDRRLAQAVRSFRRRFKLPPGESIDNKMIHYLNTPRSEYLRKIVVNIEKLKLYPHRWEPVYVEVNVPEYKMRFYRNDQTLFESDVVVGRIDRPTPIFDSRMTYMVLNPTWTIPDNLVRRDLIPMLKKNPKYLSEHNIHVFTSYKPDAPEVELDFQKLFSYEHDRRPIPYRFVQFPSETNALGRVKFMFPNKYSVYLHDTDNKKLFGYRYRVFSSGCMRVEKPFDFMDILLQYTRRHYSSDQIQEILASNRPTTILLKRPIPVHIVYFTVRREHGKDLFLYDIYLYDQIIWESMPGHKKATFRVPAKRLDPLHKPKKRRHIL